MLLDSIESFQPSPLLDRLEDHIPYVDGHLHCHEQAHRESCVKLSHVIFVEGGETHVVVDLDQAEHFVDVHDHTVALKDEAVRSVKVNYVENRHEEPGLETLAWVVHHGDRDDNED